MTLVIALKVGDGIVLGADSASTIMDGASYVNSYFNAEKLFNLRKGLPIGAVTFGLGGLNGRSVGSLAKDLRQRLTDPTQPEWYLDPAAYSMSEVADRVRRFFFDELYALQFHQAAQPPDLGFFVAGYSAGASSAEVWSISIEAGKCNSPVQLSSPADPWVICWDGVGEPLYRLVRGWSKDTLDRLIEVVGMKAADAIELLDAIQPFVHPVMPLQDAIDLVHYLMNVTTGFVRFSPGEATVAQPVDSAAITRHEGFRWVRRKHYYSPELNPT